MMTKQEFMTQFESFYKELFPMGYVFVKESNGLMDSIYISVGLIAESNDCASQIRDNDIGMGKFLIYTSEVFETKCLFHRLSCIPEKQYYAMSHRGPKFRKNTKKDLAKSLEALKKHFIEFKQFVIDNKENIYHKENYSKYIEAI